ncbi:hypothetical protein [Paraburkholderia flagellata]|uniref:hypothetical protein n=1 Tax=Paraburkholderia flagellata TaxID=2883241 RepID=UPI001F32290A|nr:hypothetical protein [Paraburkholderia flagellata]
MYHKQLISACVIAALAFAPALAQHEEHSAAQQGGGKFGTVKFPTSCSPAAQVQFEKALAMLHSFFYPSTLKSFDAVTQIDPQCAIAYWGIAIAQRPNPLIAPFDEAALKRGLEAVEKGLALGPGTERERDWLMAAEAFYKDYDKVPQSQRTLDYTHAMERLSQRYPDDSEAAIFYALALNESASPSDKTYANQLKAATILEKIYREQPDHPGVAHYLIHSYDYAPLAQRGLPFANKYAQIAPAAPHALHMPSHIYSMLGMWEPSIKSNEAALKAMQEEASRSWPGATHASAPHSWDFMEYAYLQLGQDAHAKQIRDEANAATKFPFDRLATYTALAAIPARYALERGDWQEAAQLEPRGSGWPQAEAITYFARALGCARGGNADMAQTNIDMLTQLRAKLDQSGQPYWAEQVRIQILAASAWLAHAGGKDDKALEQMRAAANQEDGSEKHVAMENRLYPMRELLGEMLLDLKRPADALKEYEASMQTSPNRLRGLYGAAKAADLAQDKQKTQFYYGKLVVLTQNADTVRPEVSEAKLHLAQH